MSYQIRNDTPRRDFYVMNESPMSLSSQKTGNAATNAGGKQLGARTYKTSESILLLQTARKLKIIGSEEENCWAIFMSEMTRKMQYPDYKFGERNC